MSSDARQLVSRVNWIELSIDFDQVSLASSSYVLETAPFDQVGPAYFTINKPLFEQSYEDKENIIEGKKYRSKSSQHIWYKPAHNLHYTTWGFPIPNIGHSWDSSPRLDILWIMVIAFQSSNANNISNRPRSDRYKRCWLSLEIPWNNCIISVGWTERARNERRRLFVRPQRPERDAHHVGCKALDT